METAVCLYLLRKFLKEKFIFKQRWAAKTMFKINYRCVKSVGAFRIRSFSGPYFPALGLNMDQKISEYRNFSRSV